MGSGTANKRTIRLPVGRRRLMPRELWALAWMARGAQPMTTGQYCRLLAVSHPIGRRSLRKLRDLRLVRVHVLGQEEASRYTLTETGKRQVVEAFGESYAKARTPRGVGALGALPHHEGTVDVAIACARLEVEHGVDLVRFKFERTIRAELGVGSSARVPDAVSVHDSGGGGRLAVAWEIDLATENPNYVAATKGQPYADIWQAGRDLDGESRWVVVCVVPTQRRVHSLVRAMWELLPEGLWFFVLSDELCRHGLSNQSAWQTLAIGDETVQLVNDSPWPFTRRSCP